MSEGGGAEQRGGGLTGLGIWLEGTENPTRAEAEGAYTRAEVPGANVHPAVVLTRHREKERTPPLPSSDAHGGFWTPGLGTLHCRSTPQKQQLLLGSGCLRDCVT